MFQGVLALLRPEDKSYFIKSSSASILKVLEDLYPYVHHTRKTWSNFADLQMITQPCQTSLQLPAELGPFSKWAFVVPPYNANSKGQSRKQPWPPTVKYLSAVSISFNHLVIYYSSRIIKVSHCDVFPMPGRPFRFNIFLRCVIYTLVLIALVRQIWSNKDRINDKIS